MMQRSAEEIAGNGDYGVTLHVSPESAETAIRAAEGFLNTIKALMQDTNKEQT